jgi:hypothetical protein
MAKHRPVPYSWVFLVEHHLFVVLKFVRICQNSGRCTRTDPCCKDKMVNAKHALMAVVSFHGHVPGS